MKNIFFLFPLFCFCLYTEVAQALPDTSISYGLMFRQLSTSSGLSNNSVRCIFRDSHGFLWIGTESGLNKYDGYTFRTYFTYNSSLPSNDIYQVFEDPEHDIWVRTADGYSIYHYKTGRFDNHYKQKLEEWQIPGRNILHVNCTQAGELWAFDTDKLYIRDSEGESVRSYPLATGNVSNIEIDSQAAYVMYDDGHLLNIDRQTSQSNELKLPAQYKPLLSGHVPAISLGKDGSLWVYTYQNSLLLHKEAGSNQWTNIRLTDGEEGRYNRVQRILDMGDGTVWILTSHTGLFIYNTVEHSLINMTHSAYTMSTIASNNLSAIFQDKDGTVWLGNFKHGISYYSPASQVILSFCSPANEDVLTFCEDPVNGYIYYGTDGNGLQRIRPSRLPEKIPTPANIIVDLTLDSQHRLWMGTYQKGLLCWSENGGLRQYTTANSGLLDNSVYAVEADRNGYIWIGTLGGHIQRLNPTTGQLETILNRPIEFSVHDMYYDGGTRLYVATQGGLVLIHTDERSYNICPENSRFRETDIRTVYQSSDGRVWLGHSHGLSVWNTQTDSIGFINQEQGLAANLVRAIMEDNYHRMWIGTGNGVSCLQESRGQLTIVNYSVNDGLISNDANVHAIFRRQNGNILLGTPKGLEYILPQETWSASYDAKVYLTGINLLSGKKTSGVFAKHSPEFTRHLTLREEDNTFALTFSALDLVEADKVKYAYRIGGKSSPWMNAEGNQVNLSILPVGHYTLEVKVCNPQGIWSPHVKKLDIRILPPWWRSWWAWTVYGCLLLGVALFVVRAWSMRRRAAHIQQAVEAEDEKLRKVSEMKLQFFANISHELRTPLSLIINPLDEFLENHPEFRKGLLTLSRQNAAYLLELINQLLDFRRLDAKAETLHCKHDNILIILSEIFHSFDIIAQKKNITYTMDCPQSSIFMDFDFDKVRKLTTNLLSNAFKFTPAKGSISMHVEAKKKQLHIRVADTGCGVDDESKEKIFGSSDISSDTTIMQGI